jgi:hypothetical protein
MRVTAKAFPGFRLYQALVGIIARDIAQAFAGNA